MPGLFSPCSNCLGKTTNIDFSLSLSDCDDLNISHTHWAPISCCKPRRLLSKKRYIPFQFLPFDPTRPDDMMGQGSKDQQPSNATSLPSAGLSYAGPISAASLKTADNADVHASPVLQAESEATGGPPAQRRTAYYDPARPRSLSTLENTSSSRVEFERSSRWSTFDPNSLRETGGSRLIGAILALSHP
jgi:hypothetical protein